ncbi:MAG: sulfatase-like hydrolase/transferase [Pirellulales bacterium]
MIAISSDPTVHFKSPQYPARELQRPAPICWDSLSIRAIGVVVAVVAAVSVVSVASADDRPNVIVVLTDDQRADTIHATGNDAIRTPNLDRLVRQGLTFRRAYAQGSMHGATCVPSRAMLLAGRQLFGLDESLQEYSTWPEAFRSAGYETFMAGKWHNGQPSLCRIFPDTGPIFLGGMVDPLHASLGRVAAGKWLDPRPSTEHTCQVFAQAAVDFLQQPHERPFFLYVAFNAPHDPHIVPADFPVRVDPESIPLPANFLPQHPWNNGEMVVRDERLLSWPRQPADVRRLLAEYYRYVSYVDTQLGRILDTLATSPHADRTIVVFTSDSGVARGSHGLIGKQNLYEHSVCVPLIMAGPTIPQGVSTDALCYLADVLPSLGRWCGVTGPDTAPTTDLTPVLRDPGRSARDQVVLGYGQVQRAIATERWKLIRYPHIDRVQLFDLAADPAERTNVADRPERHELVQRLSHQLQAELTRLGDRAPWSISQPEPADWTPPAP